jgi:hypothetical protein
MARTQARARGRPRKGNSDREYLYGLGVHKMTLVRCDRAADRWRKTITRAERYQFPPNLHILEHMVRALAEMQKAVDALERVPDDWRPAVGAVGGPLLEEGSTIEIKERHRDSYLGLLLDPSKPLTVEAVRGSAVSVQIGRELVVFPKSHIRLVPEDA